MDDRATIKTIIYVQAPSVAVFKNVNTKWFGHVEKIHYPARLKANKHRK